MRGGKAGCFAVCATETYPYRTRRSRTPLATSESSACVGETAEEPRGNYHAMFRAADGRARLGGNAASHPTEPNGIGETQPRISAYVAERRPTSFTKNSSLDGVCVVW